MADYLRRKRTVTTVEFVLPNPTNIAELGKAMDAALKALHASGIAPIYDDSILVRADDDEIVMYFEDPPTDG